MMHLMAMLMVTYDAYADDDSTEFTWNIGAGVNYQVTKAISLYTEYQYIEFGDANRPRCIYRWL
ncbi:outer membrane protein (plasmid) [Pseudoalteromonas espejiana]